MTNQPTSPYLRRPLRSYEEVARQQEKEIELWEAATKAGLVEKGRMEND